MASPEQVCPVARECGACTLIEVPYDEQLAAKQERIARLFADESAQGAVLLPIAGMDDPFGYRDKIASPFAPGKRIASAPARGKKGRTAKGSQASRSRREVLCGLYAAHSHRIIETETCPIENPIGRRVINAVRRIMRRYSVEPYDEDAGTGFMRHAVVRVGHESGEVLVTLVTNGATFTGAKNFARELVKSCPEVTTVVQNVNTRSTNVILGGEEHVLYGPGFILDTLCGLSFRISSQTFYQVNARQTEVLYLAAMEMAAPGSPDVPATSAASNAFGTAATSAAPLTILDAYCGTGTIGLVAANVIGNAQVVGVDKVESAIRDARQNAMHNGIQNAVFQAADAGVFLRDALARGASPDIVLMDPPRAGASEEFLEALAAAAPERVVYISCNPETQVRDVRFLLDRGFTLTRIQPVDMFPQTDHIESICLLEKGR